MNSFLRINIFEQLSETLAEKYNKLFLFYLVSTAKSYSSPQLNEIQKAIQ